MKKYMSSNTHLFANIPEICPGIKAPIEKWEKKGDLTIVDEVEIPAGYVG